MGTVFWLTSKTCVRHTRISGGFAVLLDHLNRWLKEHGQGPLAPEAFRDALRDEGLEVIEVAGTLLVPGLGLREDLILFRSELQKQTGRT